MDRCLVNHRPTYECMIEGGPPHKPVWKCQGCSAHFGITLWRPGGRCLYVAQRYSTALDKMWLLKGWRRIMGRIREDPLMQFSHPSNCPFSRPEATAAET